MNLGWFMGLLCLIFVTAKLWGVITWSWWLVFAPIYVPGLIFISVALFAFLIYGIIAILGK